MTGRKPSPGVSREERITPEGLERLERQLASGVKISRQVLDQWVLRYGDQATEVIRKYKE